MGASEPRKTNPDMRTGLVVLVLALIALAFFNPEMEDFQAFAGGQAERLLAQEIGDGDLGEALSGVGGALTRRYIDRLTERNNYVFFSTYTLDVDGPEQTENDWRFLGIAGQFIELQRPDALAEADENP